ncbi:MAG: TonB-dependent receptor [Gemmatimonadaceae bacterium]
MGVPLFARRSRTLGLTMLLCAAGSWMPIVAQPTAQLGQNVLRLVVVNDHDLPVPMADVLVQLGQLRARGRTDSSGTLRVDGLTVGNWHATVRRIGYGESAFDLPIALGENAFTVTVDASSEALKDVNVVEKRTGMRLVDFEKRKARGEPSAVITREQIEKRNPVVLSQMFRAMPGLQVAEEQGFKYPVAARGSVPKNGAGVTACPMRIMVDGVMRPPLSNLDDVIPSDVHGVEVYYGPASLPMQLAMFRTDKWCGLVAIWTRDR